jgi:hypothetical protein
MNQVRNAGNDAGIGGRQGVLHALNSDFMTGWKPGAGHALPPSRNCHFLRQGMLFHCAVQHIKRCFPTKFSVTFCHALF